MYVCTYDLVRNRMQLCHEYVRYVSSVRYVSTKRTYAGVCQQKKTKEQSCAERSTANDRERYMLDVQLPVVRRHGAGTETRRKNGRAGLIWLHLAFACYLMNFEQKFIRCSCAEFNVCQLRGCPLSPKRRMEEKTATIRLDTVPVWNTVFCGSSGASAAVNQAYYATQTILCNHRDYFVRKGTARLQGHMDPWVAFCKPESLHQLVSPCLLHVPGQWRARQNLILGVLNITCRTLVWDEGLTSRPGCRPASSADGGVA